MANLEKRKQRSQRRISRLPFKFYSKFSLKSGIHISFLGLKVKQICNFKHDPRAKERRRRHPNLQRGFGNYSLITIVELLNTHPHQPHRHSSKNLCERMLNSKLISSR